MGFRRCIITDWVVRGWLKLSLPFSPKACFALAGIIEAWSVMEPQRSGLVLNRLLEHGSVFRTTGSTLMNQHSSRSHAIFTIIVEQRSILESAISNDVITAKFHLVRHSASPYTEISFTFLNFAAHSNSSLVSKGARTGSMLESLKEVECACEVIAVSGSGCEFKLLILSAVG